MARDESFSALFEHAEPDGGGPGSEALPERLADPDAEPWERTYAMWTHLGAMLAFVLVLTSSGVVFFAPPLAALVLWLIRRHDSPYVDDHGREAINFHVSLLILFIPAILLGALACGVGIVLTLPAWALLGVVGGALAAAAARRGEFYRYPLCIRFLR